MDNQWVQSVDGLLAQFTTSVGVDDIVAFAALSGDDYEAHTDPERMAGTGFGGIIAHGALLVGYMSAAGTKAIRLAQSRGNDCTPVSLGYDNLRFVAPVFPGDVLTVRYEVKSIDADRRRSLADIAMTNQTGTTIAVAEHVMKWLPK
jgi:3-hydroxybutyryl-CoA dehydratase